MGSLTSRPRVDTQYKRTNRVRGFLVFTDSNLWYLRGLKKGFRHVAVLIQTEEHTILVDPLSSGVDIRSGRIHGFMSNLEALDYTVLEFNLPVFDNRLRVPSIFNCVDLVKRILGIRSFKVITPYQLYKHIKEL